MALQADRLKQLRQSRGFTQEELAERAEMHWRNVQRYEGGETDPALDAATRLARALDTSLEYLAGETDDPSPALSVEDLSLEERDLIFALRHRQMNVAVQKFASIAQNSD